MTKPRPLTPKQAAFVHEYLIDMNASAAALRAGFSPHSARDIGQQLLAKPHIARAIAEQTQSRAERTGITAERVLAELAILGFSDLRHYALDSDYNLQLAEGAPDAAMRAISSIKHRVRTLSSSDGETVLSHEVEYRLWDKNSALEKLGKHLGMYLDRTEHIGNVIIQTIKFSEDDAFDSTEHNANTN